MPRIFRICRQTGATVSRLRVASVVNYRSKRSELRIAAAVLRLGGAVCPGPNIIRPGAQFPDKSSPNRITVIGSSEPGARFRARSVRRPSGSGPAAKEYSDQQEAQK